jgi:AraC-like DNA-binding protein
MTLDNLSSAIDNFFLCTHIPMKAFRLDGTLIYSAGFDQSLDRLFFENDIFETAKEELLNKGRNSYITVNCLESISSTAFNICSCSINDGFFVMGPYQTDTGLRGVNVVYKPASCIPHLVSLFNNIRNDAYASVPEKPSSTSYSLYTEKAVDYIMDNFHKPINLEDISNHIKINRCYFCNVFKKETGKTFSQLLNEVRIDKSKELLLDRSLSILEVSLSAGFNNQNYFNMIFKKLTNMTPLEYRNNNA